MNFGRFRSKYVNLPVSAGYCPEAYANRHVVARGFTICLLCLKEVRHDNDR